MDPVVPRAVKGACYPVTRHVSASCGADDHAGPGGQFGIDPQPSLPDRLPRRDQRELRNPIHQQHLAGGKMVFGAKTPNRRADGAGCSA